MSLTLTALMKQRYDTAANWTAANPTLLAGEIGIESDTKKWKLGNGSTVWNSLGYIPGLSISAYPLVNADISATAEIAVSKLADGTPRQLLQTDAAGTGVEWASNIDVPGTLDVTGAATFDNNVIIQGDLTVNGTETIINTQTLEVEDKNIIVGKVTTPTDITADGGGITLKGTTDKTINWIDSTDAWTLSEHVNIASAKEYRIAGTKVLDATSLGSAVVSSSLTSVGTIGTGTWQGTTVATGYGGTGQTTYSNGQLLIGKTDGTLAKATLTASTGVTIVNADGSITISATGSGGTVTAVTGTSPIASTGGTTPDISIQDGTTAQKGAVQLEDSTTSTSATKAATPASVKAAYDLAAAALDSGDIGVTVQAYDADTAKLDVAQTFTAAQTFADNVTLNAQSDLRFADSDSSNWVAFQAPATVASNVTWTLPAADGTTGQVLSTNGTGTLSWATATGTSDKISEGNTEAEVVDTGSDGHFKVTTEGSERLRVTAAGLVGIGTTSPSAPLHVKSTNPQIIVDSPDASTESRIRWYKNGSSVGAIYSDSGNLRILSESAIAFTVAGGSPAESARLTSDGKFLVGTSSASGAAKLQVQDGEVFLRRSLSNASINAAGIDLGFVDFGNQDGGVGAQILAEADAAWGSGDYPGRLVFSTTADGASSPTERMRISSNGRTLFNTTDGAENETKSWFFINGAAGNQAFFAYGYQDVAGNISRSNDGALLNFRSAGVTQGSISVSGTTVSYNGAHLSRWSQLSSGAERTEILRGTVLSNLDEMCEWGEEDNEQLNRMKVSDVEGDKNVSGVFQAWDDDDDTYTNDFYCAMTGDFIIRIAGDTTVERGDLLMSAGDGTAKPQDDDIIRSRTIAKVTSTTVSCTYEDGSYCVPCVLMAC